MKLRTILSLMIMSSAMLFNNASYGACNSADGTEYTIEIDEGSGSGVYFAGESIVLTVKGAPDGATYSDGWDESGKQTYEFVDGDQGTKTFSVEVTLEDGDSSDCKASLDVQVVGLGDVTLTDDSSGAILHGDTIEYTVEVKDTAGNDITADCTIKWTIQEPSVGEAVTVGNAGNGASLTKTWNILGGESSSEIDTAAKVDADICVEVEWAGTTKSCGKTPSIGKGTVSTDTKAYKNATCDQDGYTDESMGTAVRVKKTTVAGSVTKEVTGTYTSSASVTATVEATGSVGILGCGTEVKVGVAGTGTAGEEKSETVSATVTTSTEYDILIKMYRRYYATQRTWDYVRSVTYSTGFSEKANIGTVESSTEEDAEIVVELIPDMN